MCFKYCDYYVKISLQAEKTQQSACEKFEKISEVAKKGTLINIPAYHLLITLRNHDLISRDEHLQCSCAPNLIGFQN